MELFFAAKAIMSNTKTPPPPTQLPPPPPLPPPACMIQPPPSTRQFDLANDLDPLQEPIFRYPNNYAIGPKPCRTRGDYQYGDSFSFIGHLYRHGDGKILKLYGRRRYNDLWDYYVAFVTPEGLASKTNVETRANRELFEGDEVHVRLFEEGGKFGVRLNKSDDFVYY